MLRSRTMVGELQLGTGRAKKMPIGEPIKNYYPALLSEDQYYALQSVLDARKRVTGRGANKCSNLFVGISFSGHPDNENSGMVIMQKKKTHYYILPTKALGKVGQMRAFPYKVLEEHFLKWVSELDLPGASKASTGKAEVIKGQLNALQANIKQVKAAMASGTGDFSHHLELLGNMAKQEQDLLTRERAARAAEHRPTYSTADIGAFVKKMHSLPEDERVELRQKLRAKLHSIVEHITMWIYSKPETTMRVLVAHVKFNDGDNRLFAIRVEKEGRDKLWHSSAGTGHIDDATLYEFDPQYIADEMMIADRDQESVRAGFWRGVDMSSESPDRIKLVPDKQ